MGTLAKAAIALIKTCCAHTQKESCVKDNQLKSELYCDPLGHYWCSLHKYRGELLLWSSQHAYVSIAFAGQQRYAIGDDTLKYDDRRYLWETAVLMGTDDMIMSAYRYVFAQLEEV